jgi:alpha-L-rhamnosidase
MQLVDQRMGALELQSLWHIRMEWGMKGNFLDIPTDCPQRDERLG